MKGIRKIIQITPADELHKQGFVRVWWLCPKEALMLADVLPEGNICFGDKKDDVSLFFKSPRPSIEASEVLPLIRILMWRDGGNMRKAAKQLFGMSEAKLVALKATREVNKRDVGSNYDYLPIDATLIEARTLMRALPGECVWILPSASVNPKSYHFKSPYLWLDIREILPLAKFLAHGTLYASIKKIINMSKEEFLALKVILQISDANKTEAIV